MQIVSSTGKRGWPQPAATMDPTNALILCTGPLLEIKPSESGTFPNSERQVKIPKDL